MSDLTQKTNTALLLYPSTYQQLVKHYTKEQIGEYIILIGDYLFNNNKDVESKDPMVDLLLQMSKPTTDSAAKRHRIAVENGMKGAEHGNKGGAPKGNQNARKNKENNPQTTPNQPLDIDINNNIDIDINNNIDIEIDKEKDNKIILSNNNISLDKDKENKQPEHLNVQGEQKPKDQVEAISIGEAMERQFRRHLLKARDIYQAHGRTSAYFQALERAANDAAYCYNDNDIEAWKNAFRKEIEQGS